VKKKPEPEEFFKELSYEELRLAHEEFDVVYRAFKDNPQLVVWESPLMDHAAAHSWRSAFYKWRRQFEKTYFVATTQDQTLDNLRLSIRGPLGEPLSRIDLRYKPDNPAKVVVTDLKRAYGIGRVSPETATRIMRETAPPPAPVTGMAMDGTVRLPPTQEEEDAFYAKYLEPDAKREPGPAESRPEPGTHKPTSISKAQAMLDHPEWFDSEGKYIPADQRGEKK